MFVVALTGDVGSGKSTLARVWQEQGAELIDSDQIARDQWKRADVAEAAVARWGTRILGEDGTINPIALRDIVFATEEEYRFTCSLIHPHTRKSTERRIAQLQGWVVLEIPLLYETGCPHWVDYVVYVESSPEFRKEQARLRGWDAGDLERRERRLLPSQEKKERSHAVYSNNADLAAWLARGVAEGYHFKRMASAVMLETTCADRQQASAIAQSLLEEKLIACANLFACNSLFQWDGGIQCAEECLLRAKTVRSLLPEAMDVIRQRHSYELPSIEVTDFIKADPATLRWISESCKGSQ